MTLIFTLYHTESFASWWKTVQVQFTQWWMKCLKTDLQKRNVLIYPMKVAVMTRGIIPSNIYHNWLRNGSTGRDLAELLAKQVANNRRYASGVRGWLFRGWLLFEWPVDDCWPTGLLGFFGCNKEFQLYKHYLSAHYVCDNSDTQIGLVLSRCPSCFRLFGLLNIA